MKDQRGFIQIPLIIAITAGVLALVGGSHIGIKKYQSYQIAENERRLGALLEEENRQKIQEEEQQKKDAEFDKLKQEIETLKNKKPQIIQQTIVKEVLKEAPPEKTERSLSSIIQEWRPRVVRIVCEWRYSNTNELYAQASGSGLLINMNIKGTGFIDVVMTNKHVLFKDNLYTPYSCNIYLPDMKDPYYFVDEGEYHYFYTFNEFDADLGLIHIKSPNQHIASLLANKVSRCKTPIAIGEKIVVLGYPGIGSKSDITATEGIISGRDGDYYITSAKIDHGNSGGVAVAIGENCYLGVPTFAKAGEIESLGRILDNNVTYGPMNQ